MWGWGHSEGHSGWGHGTVLTALLAPVSMLTEAQWSSDLLVTWP
jgi:hypothetical protein